MQRSTLLSLAVCTGRIPLARALVCAGADVTRVDLLCSRSPLASVRLQAATRRVALMNSLDVSLKQPQALASALSPAAGGSFTGPGVKTSPFSHLSKAKRGV